MHWLLVILLFFAASLPSPAGALSGTGYLTSEYYWNCDLPECRYGTEKTRGMPFLKDPFDYRISDDMRVKLGGRLMVDTGVIDRQGRLTDAFNEPLSIDGINVRRARVYATGGIRDTIDFRIEIDFSRVLNVEDAWVGIPGIPVVGNINAGYMKPPLSLEEITSASFTTFMERSLADSFTSGRRLGVLAHDTALARSLTWAAGAFKADAGIDHIGQWALTGRVTMSPWYAEEGRNVLHLGIGYSHQSRGTHDPLDVGTRPETHLTLDHLVDTGDVRAHSADLINPELALVYGPFSLQAEYYDMQIRKPGPEARLWGWYAYVSCFLTGEHRNYYRPSGVFSVTTPTQPFPAQGPGAWEIALRYSRIHLNDRNSGVQGGTEADYTFGINWYWSERTRIMFNYVYARAKDRALAPDGSANIFQGRFQIEF